MDLQDKQGNRFQLDKMFAKGGEAEIWTVRNQPHLVAKIYHQPTPQREAKLVTILASTPMQPGSHVATAWPNRLLYQKNGWLMPSWLFQGFLMPKIQGCDTVFNIYRPRERKRSYPTLSRRHLYHIALNLAIAIESIHAQGYVIGDVNESNILVNPQNSLVTLLDSDSFQVTDKSGSVHRCTVGKPEYTPPELMGINFNTIIRQQVHDHFGIAVLIFQLLMDGWSPFSGVLTGTQAAERVDLFCKQKGIFPYASNEVAKPPPSAPPFGGLDPEIQAAFVRCFVHGRQNPTLRPSAKEWRRLLRKAEQTLATCPRNLDHIYSYYQEFCPWCGRQPIRLLPPTVVQPRSKKSSFWSFLTS